MSDARGGVDIIPVPGAANDTDTDLERNVNKDKQEQRWREIMRPFRSNDGHMWTITEETRGAQYGLDGSSVEGYRTFKGTCRSLTHECGVGTCELQIWYKVEASTITRLGQMSYSDSIGQEESDEEGEADSPNGKKHRSPKVFLSLTKKRLQKLFRRSGTQKVRETSYPPLRLWAVRSQSTEQLDEEIVEMLDVLEILNLEGCQYTPQLLDRLSAKTPHDTLNKKAFRGGYQELAVTSIVPGEPLTDQLLRSLSAEDRDTLRQHLKETILAIWKCGIIPRRGSPTRFTWDREGKKCYMADVRHVLIEVQPLTENAWRDTEFQNWGI